MLLMVATIAYCPIVLPLILSDVSVNAWTIARPLIFFMLIPLVIGLLVKAHYQKAADILHPVLSLIANISLVLLMMITVVKDWDSLMLC